MTSQQDTALPPVAEADREAARRHFQLNTTDFFDQERLARAFAAHRIAAEQAKPSASCEANEATAKRVYKLKVKRSEDYSGEHREWTDEYILPDWLVDQIQGDVLTALRANAPEAQGEVERVARAIHEYLCRRDIMTYLDNDEDCEGIARAAIAALSEQHTGDTQ